jgi:hypothetical protein
MALTTSYLKATRHPWPCMLFLLPLLAIYEGGVWWLGGPNPEALRNGADHWLRFGLSALGPWGLGLPPVALTLVFILWSSARRQEQPADLVGVLSGMVLESVAFALILWAISRVLPALLLHLGVALALAPVLEAKLGTGQPVLTYLGAGIYEEALFRLGLYSGLVWLFVKLEARALLAKALAALASAALFSAAHHVGPYGQAYGNYLFLFRLVAGLYFALLFQLRGFGITVGAHACYNVLVSVGAP